MKKIKYSIDSLKNSEIINNVYGDSQRHIEYYNILKYANLKYKISVVDLAKIFEVERQTIYNYFSLSSKDLPQKIINKICSIYEVFSFDEVIQQELDVQKVEDELLFIEMQIQRGTKIVDISEKYDKIFTLESPDHPWRRVVYKRTYDLHNKWHEAVRYAHLRSFKFENSPYYKNLMGFLTKNSNDYNKTLFCYMSDIEANDKQFLNIVLNYIESTINNEKKNYNVAISPTLDIVKDNINKVLSIKDGLIQLTESDFKKAGDIFFHVKYKLKKANDFIFDIEENKTRQAKIVLLNITSVDNMSLIDVATILKELRSNFDSSLEVIYGHNIDKNINGVLIDLFFGNKSSNDRKFLCIII